MPSLSRSLRTDTERSALASVTGPLAELSAARRAELANPGGRSPQPLFGAPAHTQNTKIASSTTMTMRPTIPIRMFED
jgi:hypothetical protein